MKSDKSLRSSGTESRVHENNLLLCHNVLDVLDTLDSRWQKSAYLAPSKTRQVTVEETARSAAWLTFSSLQQFVIKFSISYPIGQ